MSYWSAIAAAGSAAIGALGAGDQASSARDNAREQRQWEQDMSNSAYQRQVKDMRAAGLNPILAAAQGGGASTPSGATAPAYDRISPAINSARESARTLAELKNLNEEYEVKKSVEQLNKAQATNLGVDNTIKQASAKMIQSQLPGAETEAKIDSSWYGKALRFANRLNPFSSSAGSAASTIAKFIK
ncbi:MAG: DNA pilot protein [Microviridae sp.]|nr:MAG: DNA pilot protein [Microviridae sp.]